MYRRARRPSHQARVALVAIATALLVGVSAADRRGPAPLVFPSVGQRPDLVEPLAPGAAVATEREPPPAAAPRSDAYPTRPVPANAVVDSVIDGDTVRLRFGARRETVRLLGIDTPETHRPGTPIECFGREAAAETEALLPPGTAVRVVRDEEARDRYGRLLGYVFRARDGLFVNRVLLEHGAAAALTYAPNVAHADELMAIEDDAKRAGYGLWAACGGPHEPSP